MDQKQQKELQEKKYLDKFDSITQKSKVENQNQARNIRKEGIAPINQSCSLFVPKGSCKQRRNLLPGNRNHCKGAKSITKYSKTCYWRFRERWIYL